MDKKIEFVIRENLDLKLGIYISIFSKILMKWWTRGKEKKECAIYGKAGGESRTQFKNISSHASSCGMSRTPRFFLRDGIFSSFLLFFSPLLSSLRFLFVIRITFANHIYYVGRIEMQNETKKVANDFLRIHAWEIFTLRGRRFHTSSTSCKFSSRWTLFFLSLYF